MNELKMLDDWFSRLVTESVSNPFVPRAKSVDELLWKWRARSRFAPEAFVSHAVATLLPINAAYRPYRLADVRASSSVGRFTFMSLFAGSGGSSHGYQLSGGRPICAVEFGPNPVAAYRRNNRDRRVEQLNVRDLLPAGAVERLLADLGLEIGDLDILDASPPCTEFSKAGRGVGDQTRTKVHSGVKQTSVATLPFAYAEIMHRIRPRVSVMENVEGLATSYPELLDGIVDALRFLNGERRYFVNWKVLTASDYGVPQRRRRVIVISIRADVAAKVGIRSDSDVFRCFPEPTSGVVTIRSALTDLDQSPADIRPFTRSIATSRLLGLLKSLPPNPDRHERLKNVESYFTLVRCCWDLPAPTLVIAGQKPDGLSGAIHPNENRKFTLPELKRLFGLADDYVLTGTVEQAVECICNMVPPLMTKAIADKINEQVLERINRV